MRNPEYCPLDLAGVRVPSEYESQSEMAVRGVIETVDDLDTAPGDQVSSDPAPEVRDARETGPQSSSSESMFPMRRC